MKIGAYGVAQSSTLHAPWLGGPAPALLPEGMGSGWELPSSPGTRSERRDLPAWPGRVPTATWGDSQHYRDGLSHAWLWPGLSLTQACSGGAQGVCAGAGCCSPPMWPSAGLGCWMQAWTKQGPCSQQGQCAFPRRARAPGQAGQGPAPSRPPGPQRLAHALCLVPEAASPMHCVYWT